MLKTSLLFDNFVCNSWVFFLISNNHFNIWNCSVCEVWYFFNDPPFIVYSNTNKKNR